MANAAQAHLARIVESERVRSVRRLTVVRLLGSLAAFATASLFGLVGRDPGWSAAMVPIACYCVIASALLVAVRKLPALAAGLGLSVALVDVPVVTLIAYSGMQGASERFLFGPALGLFPALVVASAMLLSAPIVAATCLSALVGQAVLYQVAGAPMAEHAIVVIAPVTTAALCIFLVRRINGLVEEARRDDLMGKYLLGERIGAGGMAEVFRATYAPEGGFERQVAVKRVLPAYAADLHFIDRFRREAELTAQLVHPNVVQVLDFGVHRDTYFLAMELVEGVSLSRLMRAEPLPLCVATWVALQLAEALDFIHNRAGADGQPLGLVHRDLNPPNVLLSLHGEVKVADFGVARAAQGPQVTATGMVVGKISYLAPEQILSQPYDARADLFALGLTLFELVSGRRAVDAESEAGVLKGLLEAQFVAPSAVRAGVSAPLDEIVLGLLERDVARRTPAAAVVRSQLLALSGEAAPYPDGKRLLAGAVTRAMATVAVVPGPKEPTSSSNETRTSTGVRPPPL